jgi:hypothetical protein
VIRRLQLATGTGCAFVALLLGYWVAGHALGRTFGRGYLSAGRQATPAAAAIVRAATLPRVVFWAWERPEDLRFLVKGQAAVAFLAKTIYLHAPANDGAASDGAIGSGLVFTVRPRLQPLRISPGTPLVAVVRIENPGVSSGWQAERAAPFGTASVSSAAPSERLASEIAALQFLPGVSGIQIDFDAPTSMHPLYAALLRKVRQKLQPDFSLSITALASWCIGNHWLEQLPAGTIDEAVPMLFRMGPDAGEVARFLQSGREFPVAACRSSLGLSTDERVSAEIVNGRFAGLAANFREKRVYVFSPRSQTAALAEPILEEWHP